MYYRGTLLQFTTWHSAVCIAENLPKIGDVNGVPAPQNQQTTAYVQPVQNPNGSDDYVWFYGKYPIEGQPDLSQDEVNALNWGFL